jgi:hypothetical protein
MLVIRLAPIHRLPAWGNPSSDGFALNVTQGKMLDQLPNGG